MDLNQALSIIVKNIDNFDAIFTRKMQYFNMMGNL